MSSGFLAACHNHGPALSPVVEVAPKMPVRVFEDDSFVGLPDDSPDVVAVNLRATLIQLSTVLNLCQNPIRKIQVAHLHPSVLLEKLDKLEKPPFPSFSRLTRKYPFRPWSSRRGDLFLFHAAKSFQFTQSYRFLPCPMTLEYFGPDVVI